ELEQCIVDRNGLAVLLQPAGDHTLIDRFAQRRDPDFHRHDQTSACGTTRLPRRLGGARARPLQRLVEYRRFLGLMDLITARRRACGFFSPDVSEVALFAEHRAEKRRDELPASLVLGFFLHPPKLGGVWIAAYERTNFGGRKRV